MNAPVSALPARRRLLLGLAVLAWYALVGGLLAAYAVRPRGPSDRVAYWVAMTLPAQLNVHLLARPRGALLRCALVVAVCAVTTAALCVAALAY